MAADTGYEAGDVNVVDGADDVVDDEFDDDFDDELDDGLDEGTGDADETVESDADGEGNRSAGGMPAAVLTYLARALADEPESVVVRSEERPGSVVLRLHVAPQDMGRVIGRRGRTAQAIRTLVAVAGARGGVQTNVDIVDE
jgi:predicted RNA-binding protein YlqC (UPF0109 family)